MGQSPFLFDLKNSYIIHYQFIGINFKEFNTKMNKNISKIVTLK